MRLTAIGLGLDEHIYDDHFLPKSTSSLRLLHFPALKEGKSFLRIGGHEDASFATLLVTFNNQGLEYQNEEGVWVGVEPRSGSVILNIGKLLSQLTEGRFKATRHRVRDIQTDRYSAPFFLEARSDAKFVIPNSDTITYGPWLRQLLGSSYIFRHLGSESD